MAAFLHQLCWRNALTNRVFSVSKHLFPSVNLHRYSLLHAGQERVFSTSVKARELNEDAPRGLPSARSPSSNYNINLRKIYVGNLFKGQTTKENRQIAKDELFKYFSSFGEVELMEFPTKSPRDPSGRGFGFVTFRDVHVAQKVLAVEEPHIIDGQTLKVAPLRNQTMAIQGKRNLTVLVKKVLRSTSKQAIEDHFSQFGVVNKVFLAQHDPADENLSSYYVMFASLSGVHEALQLPLQRIGEQRTESQVMEFPQSSHIIGKTKKLVLTSVPDQITVENLRDHFLAFGDVEWVELLVNIPLMSGEEGKRNVAFIRFSSAAVVEEITQKSCHVINGLDVNVAKHRDQAVDLPDKLRHLKLSVEGLPLSTGVALIRHYLKKAFDIVPIGVFFDRRQVLRNNQTPCIVRLSEQNEVDMVLREPKVTFEGTTLHFRRLVWRNSRKNSDIVGNSKLIK